MSAVQAAVRGTQTPPAESVSKGLFDLGLAMSLFPGFFSEVASDPNAQPQPLTDRIVGFSFGMMALGAVPFFAAAAGVSFVGGKIFNTIDGLFEMASKVKESGRSIQEQEKIIQSFGPLLEISAETLEELTKKAQEKKQQWDASTLKLINLEKKYPTNADLLDRVRERITFLKDVLPEMISKAKITVLGQIVLESRIELIQQISEEEQEARELMEELTALTQSVGQMVTKLERFEVKTAALAEVKGQLITALHGDVESLIDEQTLVSKPVSRPSNVDISISIY